MKCTKCRKDIQDDFLYCPWCGKKQGQTERKTLKRPNGTGTVYKLSGRRRKPWVAAIVKGYDNETQKANTVILGYYTTKTEGLNALQSIQADQITDKYNTTVEQMYNQWADSPLLYNHAKRD